MSVYSLSTADLKNGTLAKCGELTDGTSTYDTSGLILNFLNKANLAVLSGGNEFVPDLSKPWPWALESSPLTFVLQPPYITGTIAVTNGSTTITFSSAPTSSLAAQWLKIDNRPEWFKITAHTANVATATIDSAYTDDTASGLTFQVVKLEYDLAPSNGILRLASPFVVYRSQDYQGDGEAKIYYDDESAMLRDYPLTRIESGVPTRFCIIKKTDTTYTVRVNKIVASQTKVEARYIKNPDALIDSGSNFPIIPVESRDILEYIASYWLCLNKNDDRAEKYLSLAQAKGMAMIKEAEKEKIQTGKNRGRLVPRQDGYRRGKRFIQQETT